MEKHMDFDYELKEQVIKCVNKISNSKVVTKLNASREHIISYCRLAVIGQESEIDAYLEELNFLLILK